MFLLPLAYLPNAYDRWVLPKLVLGRLLVLVLAGLMGAQALREGKLAIRRTPLDVPLLALIASAVLSTVFAVNLNVAVFGTYSRYDGLLTLLTYAALFWLAVQTVEGPGDAAALLRTLVVGAYAVAAVAIVQSTLQSVAGSDASQGPIVRAYGSLGQWEVLGELLVLAFPLALWEGMRAQSAVARTLAINAAVVIGVAILLTFSRSAWAAALLGTATVVVAAGLWKRRRAVLGAAVAGCVLVVSGVAVSYAGGSGFERSLAERAVSALHPTEDVRAGIWHDSLRLIASRPIAGYGPDTVGLVYPTFQTVEFQQPIDKAHSEVLQIAATQGLIGVAAYVWLLAAFALTFWRGRRLRYAYPMAAGALAYQAMLQVNFTAIGSAMPFWLFAAVAMHGLGAVTTRRVTPLSIPAALGLRVAPIGLLLLGIAGVLLPVVADVSLKAAVDADYSGDGVAAKTEAIRAHQLAPEESVYAVEVGNVAFERSQWRDARDMYTAASQLGTYNPMVYRNLAISDRALGLIKEARAAARAAYELNRFDPANQALLAEFEQARNRIVYPGDSQP